MDKGRFWTSLIILFIILAAIALLVLGLYFFPIITTVIIGVLVLFNLWLWIYDSIK